MADWQEIADTPEWAAYATVLRRNAAWPHNHAANLHSSQEHWSAPRPKAVGPNPWKRSEIREEAKTGHADTIKSEISAPARILFMGFLALVSGIFSSQTYSYIFNFSILTLLGVPVAPALFFALAIVTWIAIFVRARINDVIGVFVYVILAWIAAVRVARGLAGELRFIEYHLAIAGLVGGFLGSLITAIGISFMFKSFRSVHHWMRTIGIGTIAGLALQLSVPSSETYGNPLFVDIRPLDILFIIWQPVVAASIAIGIERDK